MIQCIAFSSLQFIGIGFNIGFGSPCLEASNTVGARSSFHVRVPVPEARGRGLQGLKTLAAHAPPSLAIPALPISAWLPGTVSGWDTSA